MEAKARARRQVLLRVRGRGPRVAAGGPERLDKLVESKGSKGGGKKGGKRGDKGKGKGGVWTPTGDHGGSWIPTRAQLKGSHGGFPYPTQYQYTHLWHADGKGMQWLQSNKGPP